MYTLTARMPVDRCIYERPLKFKLCRWNVSTFIFVMLWIKTLHNLWNRRWQQ